MKPVSDQVRLQVVGQVWRQVEQVRKIIDEAGY